MGVIISLFVKWVKIFLYICSDMKRNLHFILMADIISSRQTSQAKLMDDFKKIVHAVNTSAKESILSPLTITLGDEFQGVPSDLLSALKVIVELEEQMIARDARFKLRYVVFEGRIETKINPAVAHEMLGPGLTEARNLLGELKNSNDRFHVNITDIKKSAVLNDAFRIYQGIVDGWQADKDYEIVTSFLELGDYKMVADKLNRDRSLMWKRERSQNIKEYVSLKNIISYLALSHV